MGGKIKIVNKEEQGTLVRFYLLFDPPSDAASSDSTVYNSCVFHNDFKGCKVLIGMKGLRLRSSLINWVSSRGLQVNATDDWNILLEYLQEEKDLKLLVILDTNLLPPDLSMVKDHLSMLSKFKEGGALISWVLNHDTPAEVKMRLREQGYDIMVSKPLYKSKLIKLLKSLVGTSHNQDGSLGDRRDTRDTICKGKQPSVKSNGQGSHAKVVELNLGDKQVVESSIFDIERLKVDSKNIPKATTVKAQASLAGIRILLAEDTPVIQKVAVILLTKLGATVVAVGDGQAAVDTWRESRQSSEFDLILMDCQMPRMDGYDATKEIRKGEEGSGCHIPIVALTAHAMSSDKRKCLEVGMDAYLTKPIDCKLMASTILSLTHRQ